jgi:hypothetical protein
VSSLAARLPRAQERRYPKAVDEYGVQINQRVHRCIQQLRSFDLNSTTASHVASFTRLGSPCIRQASHSCFLERLGHDELAQSTVVALNQSSAGTIMAGGGWSDRRTEAWALFPAAHFAGPSRLLGLHPCRQEVDDLVLTVHLQ